MPEVLLFKSEKILLGKSAKLDSKLQQDKIGATVPMFCKKTGTINWEGQILG